MSLSLSLTTSHLLSNFILVVRIVKITNMFTSAPEGIIINTIPYTFIPKFKPYRRYDRQIRWQLHKTVVFVEIENQQSLEKINISTQRTDKSSQVHENKNQGLFVFVFCRQRRCIKIYSSFYLSWKSD